MSCAVVCVVDAVWEAEGVQYGAVMFAIKSVIIDKPLISMEVR